MDKVSNRDASVDQCSLVSVHI